MNGVMATGAALIIIGLVVLGIRSKERSKLRTIVGSLIGLIGLLLLLSAVLVWRDVLIFLAGFLDVLATIATWIEAVGHWLVDVFRDGAAHIRTMVP